MAEDTSSMDDAALDALLENTFTEDDGSTGYVGEEDGSGSGSEDVSPSDDSDEGQSEDDVSDTHVGETDDNESEDPEASLSTDEDENDEDDTEEADTVDETDEGTSEDEFEDDSEADEEPLAFQPLRADGKEYPIESMQELYTLASKGINAERKWQDSAEGRKVSATLKSKGLSSDDINLLVELKAGNPDAIASLLKSAKIDPLDIDVDALDGDYKPKDHSVGDFEMQLDDVVARVKTQPRYEESVNVIMERWDGQSKDAFYKNPQILELLNVDMQVGADGSSMYDKVSPIAEKMKALDTGVKKSDLEYYQMAGAKVIDAMQRANQSKEEVKANKQEQETKKRKVISKKKKSAASSGGTTSPKKVVDVTELSDEALDKILEETN